MEKERHLKNLGKAYALRVQLHDVLYVSNQHLRVLTVGNEQLLVANTSDIK